MRTRSLALCLLACAVTVATPAARAEDDASTGTDGPVRIAVVVNPLNPVDSLDPAQLERIFLRQKIKWKNGWMITVFEWASDHPIRRQFSSLVLRKSPERLAEYWLNLKLTRGLKGPAICHSTTLLKSYLRRVKGGIGYLYEADIDASLKVIHLLEVSRDAP
ncbi:MAG: hypothetical protein Q9Q40_01905 [Acidobacteriota bacterium]|nr:hypothetical protein [Acidobacteriota bacterium]MDQ7088047.1 hypothetical protein [Acidobacteriota bacterium]